METSGKRVAIVTGGSKGIGAAICSRLAADGIAVLVNYSSDKDAADQVVASIVSKGGQAIAVAADIGKDESMAALFQAAERAFGGVDILVSNGGIMKLGLMSEFDDATFDRQVAINLGSVFRGIREGAKRLRDGGRIINFSSSVVGLYQPSYGVYAATKAGVEAMTHIAAKELGKKRITVNAVAPGPVETGLFTTGKTEEQIKTIAGMNPLGRIGQPNDIASVVAFLAGSDSAWVNGQIIRVNGGVV